MEYCGGGDLADYIKNYPGGHRMLPESVAKVIARQLSTARGRPSALRTVGGGTNGHAGLRFLRLRWAPARALAYMAERNIIHRDLKPKNVMLVTRSFTHPVVKLADFGFARFVNDVELAETSCGTPLYMVRSAGGRPPVRTPR